MATESSPITDGPTHDGGALIVEFCTPLWGVPHAREYALHPASRDGVWWLQSTSEPVTTFVLADPFVVDPTYVVDLGDTERSQLSVASEVDVLALVMLTLPMSGDGDITGNFRAPLVFNVRERKALQVVNRDEGHSLRQSLSLASYPLRADTAPVS
jgi:flagellar assembly factor FliW